MLKALYGNAETPKNEKMDEKIEKQEPTTGSEAEEPDPNEIDEVSKLAELASKLEKTPSFEPTSRDSAKITNISINSKGNLLQNLKRRYLLKY